MKNIFQKSYYSKRLIITFPKFYQSNISNPNTYTERLAKRNKNFSSNTEDFSNFLRTVGKDKENIKLLSKNVENNIKNLDQLDMRKVHSLIIANPELLEDINLIKLLKARNEEIRTEKGVFTYPTKNKKGKTMLVYKFYFMYAQMRERAYRIIEKIFGIVLK